MANSAHGPRLTERMRGCMMNCKAENRLVRQTDRRWRGEHQRSAYPSHSDITVHALIVRGLLEVAGRQQISRIPLSVKIAKEPV